VAKEGGGTGLHGRQLVLVAHRAAEERQDEEAQSLLPDDEGELGEGVRVRLGLGVPGDRAKGAGPGEQEHPRRLDGEEAGGVAHHHGRHVLGCVHPGELGVDPLQQLQAPDTSRSRDRRSTSSARASANGRAGGGPSPRACACIWPMMVSMYQRRNARCDGGDARVSRRARRA
jgi:hypothetical protein